MNKSWVVLGTGFIVLFFNAGILSAFGLILPDMSEDTGWSRSSLSLAVTVFMIVSAIAMPIVGRISDRYDIRLILATGTIIVAFGTGLIWFIEDFWQLVVLYGVIFAIGHAASSIPPISILVSRWWPKSPGLANSVAIAGMGLGPFVIVTILTVLLFIGWRNIYAIIGIVNVVLVLPIVLLFAKSQPSDITDHNEQTMSQKDTIPVVETAGATGFKLATILGTSKHMWLLLLVFGICGFQDFFVNTHLVAFANDNEIGKALSGFILALMGLMGLPGVIICGYITDRFGPAIPTLICFLIRTVIFVIIIYYQNTSTIVVFSLFYGSTFLITAPLVAIYAKQVFGSKLMGLTGGIIIMIHQLLGGLGAVLGAVVFDNLGSYDLAFIVSLATSIVAIVISLKLHQIYLFSRSINN
ncbi:MAG: MFS transporter [SAR202 cluster bacterium]|nr:MFS transporter [SAR202 cluster bacterium]|tara:strand:- start:5228 stop:6463 length:1236 start_codon:yes stop_codon:yes gene_type:complete